MSARFVAIGSTPAASPAKGPKAHHRRTARHGLLGALQLIAAPLERAA